MSSANRGIRELGNPGHTHLIIGEDRLIQLWTPSRISGFLSAILSWFVSSLCWFFGAVGFSRRALENLELCGWLWLSGFRFFGRSLVGLRGWFLTRKSVLLTKYSVFVEKSSLFFQVVVRQGDFFLRGIRSGHT
jgi:hypothetical protein